MKDWQQYNWDDVVPDNVPVIPGHMAQIAYSPDFTSAMGVFRAVAAKHEISERVLALTSAIIKMNSAHYSVWDYRLEVVSKIGNDVFDYREVGLAPNSPSPPQVGEDGEWLNLFTMSNAKNYQVWNYRQHLADERNSLWYKGEKVMLHMVLEDDAKNFHAWSHYKWLVQLGVRSCPQVFGDGSALLDSTKPLLAADVLNNSVWSFRYFLLYQWPNLRDDKRELEFVKSCVAKKPANESVWSYLRGYIVDLANNRQQAEQLARQIAMEYPDENRAIEFLAEILPLETANALWKKLGLAEPTRQVFWESRIQTKMKAEEKEAT